MNDKKNETDFCEDVDCTSKSVAQELKKEDVKDGTEQKRVVNSKTGLRKLDNWELMHLAEEQDCEAYEAADLEEIAVDYKRRYRDFYDDVKQPVDYIKEDW